MASCSSSVVRIPDVSRVSSGIWVDNNFPIAHLAVRLNLRPDNPFAGGIVNRVVQGVTIHDHAA